MLIDTHLHESKYSFDSHLSLEEAVETAKAFGLDGICVTNHDNNHLIKDIGKSKVINDILVIVGAEILTKQGDILVFGLDDIPEEMLQAEELLKLVKKNKGIAISAHPFRDNNRGLGEYINSVKDSLDGVEAFNGSTLPHHNLYAYTLATELKIPCFGAGDAHVKKQIGKYATHFNDSIRDSKDFIEAVKTKDFYPVKRKEGVFKEIDIYYDICL